MAEKKKPAKRCAQELREDHDVEQQSATFSNRYVKQKTFTAHSAAATSSEIKAEISRVGFQYEPPKKPVQVEPLKPVTGDESTSDKVLRQARSQTMSALLRQFTNRIGDLMDYILASEAGTSVGAKCSHCKEDPQDATTRCKDCFQGTLSCDACFLKSHQNTPFHWAEKWNGSFFVQHDFSELGGIVSLGHHGKHCPNIRTNRGPRKVYVVTTNGVHTTQMAFCECGGASSEDAVQLMEAQLFPGSMGSPGYAFSFELLRSFHLHNLESKKSAYDFIKAIRRMTNNAFTKDVPDPYSVFLRVVRVWRLLNMLKRSGQAHGIDKVLTHRKPGNMTVVCPACPEPGFNMEERTEPLEESRKKKKVDDPDDVALIDGAYFPNDAQYKEYLKTVGDTPEKSTCAHLNAVNMQEKMKFKNMEITGVVACKDGRHDFFRRGAMVDLQKGERYANSDYALAQALKHNVVEDIIVTYDISCQYCINLVKRFAERFPNRADIIKFVKCLVPKLHLQGHKDDCQYRYSLNYTPGVGRTHGEGIESGWAESNQAGGSTKEMNHGHWHDTLNDFHGDWNWVKMQNIGSTLYRMLTNARAVASKKRENFKDLCLTLGSARMSEWEELPIEPTYHGGEWYMPSQANLFQQMLATEMAAVAERELTYTPVTMFLNNGIKIQSKQ
ncbi:hypothetical protein BD410DRAFT_843487 [Rickenella mellea]|uniref:CxC2-like cysteine cluster KDZ transposase-associated domain-containing protein n=1 Tax=Rickenella mellea TaxID=50990 RepID=A0A4Y7PR37_9AGAM|nr:hypothetical protein BD410DRAFT_843487 [Rickenella mellea]